MMLWVRAKTSFKNTQTQVNPLNINFAISFMSTVNKRFKRVPKQSESIYLCRNGVEVSSVLGQLFFFFFFVFSLTCYRVFFSVPSGISLVTLLCYLLYVNFVIVYYLALIYCQFFTGLLVSHHSSK